MNFTDGLKTSNTDEWETPAEVLINYHTDLVWKEDSGTDA